MIYATDLDRTLIFSERMLQEYPSSLKLEVVEADDARVISYASSASLHTLKKLQASGIKVIPATARSLREYNRVNLGFDPEYAIIANGGIILKGTETLDEWEKETTRIVYSIDFNDIMRSINRIKSVNNSARMVDERYVFARAEDPTGVALELEEISARFTSVNFTILNKKIYVSPKRITKGTAIEFLRKFNGWSDTLVAAGDGEPDVSMLRIADVSIAPEHGDIVRNSLYCPTYTVCGGVQSAIEALNVISTLANLS